MLRKSILKSTSKYLSLFTYLFRAYQTLSDPKKRKVYDATGMTSNEQQGADINYDGFNSFQDMFRSAFQKEEEMTHKTYEQILEEYEKFFSLEQEQSKKQSDDRVRGANIVKAVNVSFAEMIEGAQQIITY